VNVSGSHLQEGAFEVEKKQEQPEQKKQEPKKQTPAVGARPQKNLRTWTLRNIVTW
jgi:hypothetical protein